MAERKPEWPEVGDLVIATIETVTDYGASYKLYKTNSCAQNFVFNVTNVSGQGSFRREK